MSEQWKNVEDYTCPRPLLHVATHNKFPIISLKLRHIIINIYPFIFIEFIFYKAEQSESYVLL